MEFLRPTATHDGRTALFARNTDGASKLFVRELADPAHTRRLATLAVATVIAIAPDDRRIATGDPRGHVLFWNRDGWQSQAGPVHESAIVYGRSAEARIADPADPRRVFSWLLEETRDDRGNLLCYRYKAEDGVGVDPGKPSESNRFRYGAGARTFLATAQRYLKRVQYGNRVPVARDQPAPTSDDAWLFEVVFDFGEHDLATPTPAETMLDGGARGSPRQERSS